MGFFSYLSSHLRVEPNFQIRVFIDVKRRVYFNLYMKGFSLQHTAKKYIFSLPRFCYFWKVEKIF